MLVNVAHIAYITTSIVFQSVSSISFCIEQFSYFFNRCVQLYLQSGIAAKVCARESPCSALAYVVAIANVVVVVGGAAARIASVGEINMAVCKTKNCNVTGKC